MDDHLVVQLPQFYICGICAPWARVMSWMAVVGLEPLFDEHGELIGLHTVVRYPFCGHLIPEIYIPEEDVAGAMENPSMGTVLRAMLRTYDEDDGYGND